MRSISIIGVEGIPEVREEDDVAALIVAALGPGFLHAGDVVVVAHKILSKAEGRFAPASNRDTTILAEAARVLRRSDRVVIAETRHGFVCANAGVDASNVAGDRLLMLPIDPDLTARRLRARFANLTGCDVGVIVSDTFGRAWRLGQTNVAIGVAGIDPFVDYRHTVDVHGRSLSATRICIADEIAGAAEMVMGKVDDIPAAVVRNVPASAGRGAAAEIVRPPAEDLFR